MKAIVCEMCSSNNVVKKDGLYECQNCGVKYSVDDAKKLIIEVSGQLDVSGSTVKVDKTTELHNLYQIARRAKNDNNATNAIKYYDMILVHDSTSWEATFYPVYFRAMTCKIAEIESAAVSVANCEGTVLGLIKESVDKTQQKSAVYEVMTQSMKVSEALSQGARNNYLETDVEIRDRFYMDYINRYYSASEIMFVCGDQIDLLFGDDTTISQYSEIAWKNGIEQQEVILNELQNRKGIVSDYSYRYGVRVSNRIRERIITCTEKIGKYNWKYSKDRIDELKREKTESEIYLLKGEQNKIKNPSGSHSMLFIIGVAILITGILSLFITAPFLIWLSLIIIAIGGLLVFAGIKKEKTAYSDPLSEGRIAQIQDQIDSKQETLYELEHPVKPDTNEEYLDITNEEYLDITNEDYLDITCPSCGKRLSFMKSSNSDILRCPYCDSEVNTK